MGSSMLKVFIKLIPDEMNSATRPVGRSVTFSLPEIPFKK